VGFPDSPMRCHQATSDEATLNAMPASTSLFLSSLRSRCVVHHTMHCQNARACSACEIEIWVLFAKLWLQTRVSKYLFLIGSPDPCGFDRISLPRGPGTRFTYSSRDVGVKCPGTMQELTQTGRMSPGPDPGGQCRHLEGITVNSRGSV
jgi:hypothetical protein